MAGRSIKVEILGDASSLERAFRSAGLAAGGFGSSVGKAAKIAAFAAGGAALGGLAVTLKVGVSEWKQHALVAAQTAAALKSTGGAAKVTAKQVEALANSLLRKTGIDDEATQAAENQLLRFRAVRNEVGKGNDMFNQATKATADLATRLNNGAIPSQEQMAKAAVLVGKALNDPVRGMTQLRRVGVSFTAEQQKQIKALVESGRVMEAQKIIMDGFTKTVGGSAEAAGKTLPGQLKKLREEFNNLAAWLVQNLIPTLVKVVDWTNAHWPQIEATFRAVATGIGFAIQQVIVPTIRALIAAGETAVGWFQDHWAEISTKTMEVFNSVKAVVTGAVAVIEALWARFGDTIISQTRAIWDFIKNYVQGALNVIRGIVNVIGGLLHGDWSRVWQGLQQIFSGLWTGLVATVRLGFQTLLNMARALGQAMLLQLSAAWNGIKTVASRAFGAVAGAVTAGLNAAKNAALAGGRAVMDGMLRGLRIGWNAVTGWLSKIPGYITGFFGNAGAWLIDAGRRVMSGLISGILSKLGDLGHALGGIGGFIVHHKGPPEADSQLLYDNGQRIMQSLINGLLSKMPQVKGAAQQAIQQLRAGVQAGEILAAMQAAGQTLGMAQARGVVMGIIGGTPSVVAQVKASLNQALTQARQDWLTKFSDLASKALAAFDAKFANWKPPSQKLLEKMQLEDQLKQLTDGLGPAVEAAELALASAFASGNQKAINAAQAALNTALTAAQTQIAADAQANVDKAQAAVDAATATGDQGKIDKAQADLQTALDQQKQTLAKAQADQRALVEQNLSLRAAMEQRGHDRLVAQQRNALAQALADLKTWLAKHPEEWNTTQQKIIKLLQTYEARMKNAGQNLADQFAAGIRAGIPGVQQAAQSMAAAVDRNIPHSPAKEGPLAYDMFKAAVKLANQWTAGLKAGGMPGYGAFATPGSFQPSPAGPGQILGGGVTVQSLTVQVRAETSDPDGLAKQIVRPIFRELEKYKRGNGLAS